MDNDVLINQARELYAVLQIKQCALSGENPTQIERISYLTRYAYCRYQRRLNRCVLCYQNRSKECERDEQKKCVLKHSI